MSIQVQHRRGNTTQTAAFTGAIGEITIDTDKNTVVVHDGATPGGRPLAPNTAFDVANAAFGSANNVAPQVAPAFNTANAAYGIANASFGHSNLTYGAVNSAFGVINAAFGVANNAYTATNGTAAFAFANGVSTNTTAAFGSANTVGGYANTAGSLANQAGVIANAAFGAGNTAGSVANNANTYAGSTYVKKAGDTISGDLVVQGNLTISGISTSLNTSNLYIGDNMITLNADIPSSVAPVENAGIEINRGNKNSNAAILWIETQSAWSITSNNLQAITTYIATNTDVTSANNYAGAMANGAGTIANAAFGLTNTTYAAVNSAFGVINAAFGIANNAYTSTNGTAAFAFANGVATNTTAAFAFANGVSTNTTAAFGFANGVSTNTTAAFGLTNTTYAAVNSAFGVINAAYGRANSAVMTAYVNHLINGTTTLTPSSNTAQINIGVGNVVTLVANTTNNAVIITLPTSGVTATTYGGATQIPVLAVDAYGRVTTASNVAVQGMDYAYANTIWGQANTARDAANSKVDTITSNSTSRVWANAVVVGPVETVYLDLATSGVTATNYGGSTQIPTFTVDAYGRVTAAANVTFSALANTSGTYYNGNLFFPSGNVAIGNTTYTQKFEVSNGNMAVDGFYENSRNLATSYTITTNRNAMSAGPITINSGITITVPSGSTWTIV